MEEKDNPEAKMAFALKLGDKLVDKSGVKAAAAAANVEVAEGIVENLTVAAGVGDGSAVGATKHDQRRDNPAVLSFNLNMEAMAEYLKAVSSFQSPGDHLATLQVHKNYIQ
jgi:hypothetical protein